jgi:hypothetical protein
MKIEGAIVPAGDGRGFSREAWCQLVGSRPELRRPASRQAPNPFAAGELMTMHPPEDAAEIMLEGRVAGAAGWSMSDEPLVNVSVEPAAMHFVKAWAESLGGEFVADSESN